MIFFVELEIHNTFRANYRYVRFLKNSGKNFNEIWKKHGNKFTNFHAVKDKSKPYNKDYLFNYQFRHRNKKRKLSR